MTSPSSENSVRRLAVTILRRYQAVEPCEATEEELQVLTSLLSEAMEENTKQGSARIIFDQGESKGRREGRSAAYRDAMEIVLNECGNGCTSDHRDYIADKLRRKAGGGE